MARARNIKPKFFQNDELGELSPLARLLFIGLWTIADFNGCLEYRPKRIKAQILPYDDCSIEGLVSDLDKSGFISIYSVASQPYIKILKFKDHQNPHKNERDAGGACPDISQKDNEFNGLRGIEINRDKDGSDRAESLFPLTESLLPLPDSGIPLLPASPDVELAEQFEEVWAAYPKRAGASKADSLKAWKARIKAGATADEILEGVWRYAKYVAAERTEDRFIKQPQTFFGPGNHFRSDWSVRAAPGAQSLDALRKASNEEAKRRLFGAQPEMIHG